MKDEYVKNQKKQIKALNAYKKHNKKGFIYGLLAIAVAAFFPRSLALGLQGLFGDFWGGSIAFFTQWGIAGISAITSAYNLIKARHSVKKLENSQDEEGYIIDRLELDRTKKEGEVNSLKKTINRLLGKSNTKEEISQKAPVLDNIEKENKNSEIDSEEKGKTYIKD